MNGINDFINNLVSDLYEEYKDKRENFIFNCLIEMGYKGTKKQMKKIKKFIAINKIEIFSCPLYKTRIEKITVKSDNLNYKKEDYF